MNILVTILVILHLIGMAYLLGAFLVQIKEVVRGKGRILRGILDGALLQLITGLVLVGIFSAGLVEGEKVDNITITIKAVFAVAIYVIALVYRKREVAPSWALWLIGALTLVNVVLGVAFTTVDA